MISYKLVMPEHLNDYGRLFGGNLLKWVDEFAWIAVSTEYAGSRFVTIGMNRVEFRKCVCSGSILRFEVAKLRTGTTSVTYQVEVFRRELRTTGEESIFQTEITFVRVDEHGNKIPVKSQVDH